MSLIILMMNNSRDSSVSVIYLGQNLKGSFSAELYNDDGILNIKSPVFTELHGNEIE
jgi:hypothetical protein